MILINQYILTNKVLVKVGESHFFGGGGGGGGGVGGGVGGRWGGVL